MSSAPLVGDHLVVSTPLPHVLLLRLNRPSSLNAMTEALEHDLKRVLDWFESNEDYWVGVVTGTGRAFCAGQDLKQFSSSKPGEAVPTKVLANPDGFGSLSRRKSRKVMILAVNGLALGGGGEIVVNADIVVGGKGCTVGFPEVKRGIVAGAGGIPNVAAISPQLVPYLYTGDVIPQSLVEQYLFHDVVQDPTKVLERALEWAARVTEASPDALRVTKAQLNALGQGKPIRTILEESALSEAAVQMREGFNVKEGMRSFAERRKPSWRNPLQSKL